MIEGYIIQICFMLSSFIITLKAERVLESILGLSLPTLCAYFFNYCLF